MTARIVVGVDGSPQSRVALDTAIEEARLRHGTVEAVHTWQPAIYYAPPEYVGMPQAREDYVAASRDLLDKTLADAPDDVTIETTVLEGPAAPTLVRHSREADLLVVGSRGRGGFSGLLLGSTSHWVTSHATCPVLVVPSGYERPAQVADAA